MFSTGLSASVASVTVSVLSLVAQPAPRPTVDSIAAALAQVHAEVQPVGADAWPLYETLEAQFDSPTIFIRVRDGDDETLRRLSELNDGAWGDPRHAPLLQALDDRRAALDVLDRAAARPACVFPIVVVDGDAIDPFTGSAVLSAGADVNRAAMRDAAHRGDWIEVERRLTTGMRMATHLTRHPLIASSLVGHVNALKIAEEAALLAFETPMPASVARRLAGVIEESDVNGATPRDWPLAGEHLMVEGALLAMASAEDEPGDADDEFEDEEWTDEEPPVTAETFARLDLVCALLGVWMRGTPHARFAGRVELPEGVDDHPLVESAAGALSRFSLDRDRFAMLRRGHALALRIAAFRAEEGRWPRTLDDLGVGDKANEPVFGARYEYTPPASRDALPTLRIADTLPVYSESAKVMREVIRPRRALGEDSTRRREGSR